jgi:hypothetical protein
MNVGGLEVVFAILAALLGIAVPLAFMVMLFLIYSKLNRIEKLLSRGEEPVINSKGDNGS